MSDFGAIVYSLLLGLLAGMSVKEKTGDPVLSGMAACLIGVGVYTLGHSKWLRRWR